jgi:HAD superfamily hydrolase (TIGR01490 family)
MMKNLAIFDFCDTLVNFQTADAFCRFVLLKREKHLKLKLDGWMKTFKIYGLLEKSNLYLGFQKKFLLNSIKGINYEDMKLYAVDFVNDIILKNTNKVLIDRLIEHQKKGDLVVINSGGFDIYLSVFAKKFNITKVYATQLDFSNGIFSGKINGKDCLGYEKVTKMNQDKLLENEFESVFVYSDSMTDLPIFNLASRKYAVIYHENIPSWCSTSDFDVIKIKR